MYYERVINICLLHTLLLMNHYLEARQWLRPGVDFEVFRDRFPG